MITPVPVSARSWLLVFTVVLVSLPSTGCGSGKKSKVYSAKGEVFVMGKPAEGATVILCPPLDGPVKISPTGVVGPDGSYQLSSYKVGDGAPAGEYSVVIVWDKTEQIEGEERIVQPDKLGGRFANPKASPYKATIKKGSNQIPRIDIQY